jgi:hypothetical protein
VDVGGRGGGGAGATATTGVAAAGGGGASDADAAPDECLDPILNTQVQGRTGFKEIKEERVSECTGTVRVQEYNVRHRKQALPSQ